jgi:hypothetical protein
MHLKNYRKELFNGLGSILLFYPYCIKTKRKAAILPLCLLLSATNAQTEKWRSMFVAVSPLISFQNTEMSDPNNIVKNTARPSFAFELGYMKVFNKGITGQLSLCIKQYKYKTSASKFPPFMVTDYFISPKVDLRVGKIVKLNENLRWQYGVGILLGYLNETIFTLSSNDTVEKATRNIVTTWHGGIKPFIGIHTGLHLHPKRLFYIGLSYYQGFDRYYSIETHYTYGSLSGASRVSSKATHFQLDLRYHFLRRKKDG